MTQKHSEMRLQLQWFLLLQLMKQGSRRVREEGAGSPAWHPSCFGGEQKWGVRKFSTREIPLFSRLTLLDEQNVLIHKSEQEAGINFWTFFGKKKMQTLLCEFFQVLLLYQSIFIAFTCAKVGSFLYFFTLYVPRSVNYSLHWHWHVLNIKYWMALAEKRSLTKVGS